MALSHGLLSNYIRFINLIIKNISLQVHIACIFVILNFILFCTHAAVAVLQVYYASHTIYYK